MFILKSILSDMKIATSAFFGFPFAWNNFSIPSLCLYVSLDLKWISCRQHIYKSCLCIFSASLYFSVGTFNPFTFKLITNMHVLIAILLIALDLFFIVFFSSLPLLYSCDLMTVFSLCLH